MDTRNNSQYLVINHNGRECEKDTNIYVKLNHISVPRNPHIVNQLYFNLKSKERKKSPHGDKKASRPARFGCDLNEAIIYTSEDSSN